MSSFSYDPITNEFHKENQLAITELPQVMWHITDRCPLACPYCFATKTGKEMTMAEVYRVIEVMKALNVLKIDIAGGEPLVHPNLSAIVELLVSTGFAVTITTSGVGPTSNIQWLVSHASLFSRIIFSIDGPSQHHDRLRGRIGVFDAVRRSVSELKSLNYHQIRLNTVAVRLALQTGYAEEMVKAVTDISPNEWCLIQPHPANRKNDFDSYAITDHEFSIILKRVKAAAKDYSFSGQLISRKASDYSGYWVLYPDGTLRKHTSGPADHPVIPFTIQGVGELREGIRQFGFSLPGEGPK